MKFLVKTGNFGAALPFFGGTERLKIRASTRFFGHVPAIPTGPKRINLPSFPILGEPKRSQGVLLKGESAFQGI